MNLERRPCGNRAARGSPSRAEGQAHRALVPVSVAAGVEAADLSVSPPAADNVRVTTIMVMDATLPLAEIKKRLSEIVDGIETRHDRVVLTRNGRPAAVLISPDDLEALEETLEMLSNPAAMRAITRAETEIDKGKALTADQLRAKYLDR